MKNPALARTQSARPANSVPSTTFAYHGGPVMTEPVNLYVIWYGQWPSLSRKKPVVQRVLRTLGQSTYFGINTAYTQSNGKHVTHTVHLAAETVDAYSSGKVLQDASVATIVGRNISSTPSFRTNANTADKNGIYIVISSSDVRNTSGFLTTYCGWHSSGTMGNIVTKFIFAGDPSANLIVCAPPTNRDHSPNDYPGMDAAASTIAHEISETVTDPELNAWFDDNHMENADLCAWQYGKTYSTNQAQANLQFEWRDYLIQENWNLTTHSCSLN